MTNDTLIRIHSNIATLLAQGQFPGSAAPALAEAQSFVAAVLADLEKQSGKAAEGTRSSVRDGSDPSGMVGGGIPNRGKQGRRKKGK
jgi:hypothetical protein